MKGKKVKICIILLVSILIISLVIFCLFKKKEENQGVIEYVPVEEISQEQERKTIVSVYYNNVQTNCLTPEARLIDVKDLARKSIFIIIKYVNRRTKK